MDLKQIKELIATMEKAGIKKLTIKQKNGDELHLERQEEASQSAATAPSFYPPAYPFHHHPPPREQETGHKHVPPPTEESGQYITSPLVGTFYWATSPEDPPFVKVGDRVTEETVVCIIEAMKVMNEVKAGKSGMITEVLVENAHPVEFGTKLFQIK